MGAPGGFSGPAEERSYELNYPGLAAVDGKIMAAKGIVRVII